MPMPIVLYEKAVIWNGNFHFMWKTKWCCSPRKGLGASADDGLSPIQKGARQCARHAGHPVGLHRRMLFHHSLAKKEGVEKPRTKRGKTKKLPRKTIID